MKMISSLTYFYDSWQPQLEQKKKTQNTFGLCVPLCVFVWVCSSGSCTILIAPTEPRKLSPDTTSHTCNFHMMYSFFHQLSIRWGAFTKCVLITHCPLWNTNGVDIFTHCLHVLLYERSVNELIVDSGTCTLFLSSSRTDSWRASCFSCTGSGLEHDQTILDLAIGVLGKKKKRYIDLTKKKNLWSVWLTPPIMACWNAFKKAC